MKKAYCFVLLFAVVFAHAADDDFLKGRTRTWTSAGGSDVVAEYVGRDGDMISLKTEDGKTVKIAVKDLSAADRALFADPAEEEADKKKSRGGDKGRKRLKDMDPAERYMFKRKRQLYRLYTKDRSDAPFLPALRNDVYMTWNRKTYDAEMDTMGALWVLLKDSEGSYIHLPIHLFDFGASYRNEENHYYHRAIAEFTEHSEPAENPDTITMKGILEDQPAFTVTYEFGDDYISARAQVTDPSSIKYPTDFHLGTKIPPTIADSAGMEPEEMKAEVNGMSVTVDPNSGSTLVMPYWKSSSRQPDLKEVKIAGHYDPYTLTFRYENVSGNRLEYNVYLGTPPFSGYGVNMDTSADCDGAKVTLSINR